MEEDETGSACNMCGERDMQTGIWLLKLRE